MQHVLEFPLPDVPPIDMIIDPLLIAAGNVVDKLSLNTTIISFCSFTSSVEKLPLFGSQIFTGISSLGPRRFDT